MRKFLRRNYIKSSSTAQIILVVFGIFVSAFFSDILTSIIDFGIWEKVAFDFSFVLVIYVVVIGLLIVMEK